jgi:hypothetical protein
MLLQPRAGFAFTEGPNVRGEAQPAAEGLGPGMDNERSARSWAKALCRGMSPRPRC